MTAVDVVVVGQGLAGSAVAWHLRWWGRRVLVIDRGDPDSASRVAAGLVTPITGKRLARTPGYDRLYPAAVAFYRRVEAETGVPLYDERPAARLFPDEREREKYLASGGREPPDGSGSGGSRPPLAGTILNPTWFDTPSGAAELAPAGRLDVSAYLDASRRAFAADGGFLTADLEPAEVIPEPEGVRLPRLGIRAGALVFCQGFAGRGSPWLPDIRFTPAKGEVLTLRVSGLTEGRVVHRGGVWLAPTGGGLFLAGSTYDRDDFTPTPTARGRDEILTKLRAFLRLPFEVIDHRAAVRPIVAGLQPVAGVHPVEPRLAYLNGLASKGVLTAPFVAAELVARLCHGGPGDGQAGICSAATG